MQIIILFLICLYNNLFIYPNATVILVLFINYYSINILN